MSSLRDFKIKISYFWILQIEGKHEVEKSGDALSKVQVHQDALLFTPQFENIAPMGKIRSIIMKGIENMTRKVILKAIDSYIPTLMARM